MSSSLRSSMRNNLQSRKVRTSVGNHNIDTAAPSKTDDIADASFKIARDQLIPQAIKRQSNALKTDQRLIYVYFKKTAGRPCSCLAENNTPEGRCQICFKTGYVGGFDKFGTHSEILDITSASSSFNIVGNFKKRPVPMTLDEKALNGTIVFDFEVKNNIGILDLLQTIDYQPEGSAIVYSIFNGITWVPLNEDNIVSMLGQPTMKIKVDMSRRNLQQKSPELNHVRIRYEHREEMFVRSDWPHPKNSRTLAEFGIFNSWQTLSFNLDNTIAFINPEDWVFRADRNERWKIIEVDRFDPETLLLGHDVTVRLVQPHEIYTNFPL